MRRQRSTGGILWGLILVTAGSVLLARNLGYPVPVWTGLATYWPLLLVLWGGVKIVEYVRLRHSGEDGRLFSPGEVVLLIFIIVAGTAASAAARLNPGLAAILEMADIELWPITGNEYAYTEHYEAAAAPGSEIEIVNRYGDVEVLPDDIDQVTVDVRKIVIAETQEDADELAQLLVFSIVPEAPGYRIVSSFNRDQNSVRGRRFRTSLTIRVPSAANIHVDNRNGTVTLRELQGNQEIDNQFGDVVIREIDGDVAVDNRNGTVRIENVNGSVAIDNGFASTTVARVSGNVNIDTRNGMVEVTDIGGDTRVENAFAAVTVTNVAGRLEIEAQNSALDVDNVSGDVDVESAFQSIRVRNAHRGIRVTNRNGDVDVQLADIPSEDIAVATQFSNVTLEVPFQSGFDIDLFTRFGQIETDLGLPVATNGPERALTGRIGPGGPSIRIRTQNGDIRVIRL